MAEVSGSLIFKVSDSVFSKLSEETGGLSSDDLQAILDSSDISLTPMHTEDFERSNFSHEGLEKRKGYILIYPFDEEYMALMKLIINKGKKIEAYGLISHEYGTTEYYALNKDGERFVGTYDAEGEDNLDQKELIANLIKLVPDEVKKIFDDIF
jgi:hypothetical protein